MFETLFTARFSKTLGIGVIAGATLVSSCFRIVERCGSDSAATLSDCWDECRFR
jgi:hypothetical protein